MFPTQVSLLEHQRTDCVATDPAVGSSGCKVHMSANLAGEWEYLTTLARRMHVHKSLVSYP